MNGITLEAQAERIVIVPEAGCQCASYSVGALDLIVGPDSPESWRDHPFRSGIPVLFPWPGRVANAQFTFGGRTIQLPVNEPIRGHAIHGLTWKYPFRVTKRGPYFLHTELNSSEHPDLERVWPWRFTLALEYEIGNGLRIRAKVLNNGDSPMPFGFGTHPYFRVPLGKVEKRAQMSVRVPAMDSQWPLDQKLIPTGAPVKLEGKNDLREERALGSNSYDDAFHLSPARDPSQAVARLIDRAAKIVIELRADSAFGQFVFYAPPDRDVVSLEAYTCAPDAFNLGSRGVESGMRQLAPGETFDAGLEIRVSSP